MLIEFEVNFKLPIMRFRHIFRWCEKLQDVIFGKQRAAKDSHDLRNRSPKLEIMLNDSDETICDDGNMNLNTHCIVAISPERLDPKMLLNPLEEKLNLPSVFIEKSDVLCCKIEVVRVVSERTVQVWGIIYDTPDRSRILLLVLLFREGNGLVTQHIVLSVKNVFSVNDFIARTSLLTDDEECSGYGNFVKSGEVKVAPVKDITCQRLVGEPVHKIDIMYVCIGDSVEQGNLCDDIHLSVDFDSRLRTSELRLAKERHAEIDGRGVHCIEPAMQLKLSSNPSLLGKENHVEGKLLKDVIVPEVVGLGKSTFINRCLSESEMKRLLAMSDCYIYEFSQSFATHELSKHKDEKMAPVRGNPILGSVTGFDDKTLEIPLWKKAGYLSENVLSEMHMCPIFVLDAKVRISKVRQGFRSLLCCA